MPTCPVNCSTHLLIALLLKRCQDARLEKHLAIAHAVVVFGHLQERAWPMLSTPLAHFPRTTREARARACRAAMSFSHATLLSIKPFGITPVARIS
jgi:hypothetical protein